MSKCFLLNPGKNLAQIRVNSDAFQFRKNDITDPKATLIASKDQFQQPFANKIVRKKSTDLQNDRWNWSLLVY